MLNPLTDFRNAAVVTPWIKEMPAIGEECINWVNPSGAPGTNDLATTVLTSGEQLSGATTYEFSIAVCAVTQQTVVKTRRFNVPDALTSCPARSTPVTT